MSGFRSKITLSITLIPILFFAQIILLFTCDADRGKKIGAPEPAPMFGAALLGFRSVVSDLMWIESDRYFHDGRYELALGAINVAAMMDPKFVQAWALGAWHMIYNFKLVPEGFQFLRRGINENPDHYRLHFEMSFNYFFKLENFPLALAYAKNAVQLPDRDTGEPHPSYVERLLAHSYEEMRGEENWLKAMETWQTVQRLEPTDPVPPVFLIKLQNKINAEKLEKEGKIQESLSMWEDILSKHSQDRTANEKIEELRARSGLPVRPPSPDNDDIVIPPKEPSKEE